MTAAVQVDYAAQDAEAYPFATVQDEAGGVVGTLDYHPAGSATRWDFVAADGTVMATARLMGWGYAVRAGERDLGGYPALTVAAQDIYGQRVRVIYSGL